MLKTYPDKKQVLERGTTEVRGTLEAECMHRRGKCVPIHCEGPHDKACTTQGKARSGLPKRVQQQRAPCARGTGINMVQSQDQRDLQQDARLPVRDCHTRKVCLSPCSYVPILLLPLFGGMRCLLTLLPGVTHNSKESYAF